MIDATIVESAARPKRVYEMNEDCQEAADPDYSICESVDPNARWLKKGKRCYFGYKGFIVSWAPWLYPLTLYAASQCK